MKSLAELYENANKTTTKSKFITPEVVTKGDTITITGPSPALALRAADWSDEYGGSVTFRLENEEGGYINKRIYEFDFDKQVEFASKNKKVRNGELTAEELAEQNIENGLNNLIYLHNKAFGKSHTANLSKTSEYTVKALTEALFGDAPFENTPYNIHVKMQFREESGPYPKYEPLKYGAWWNGDPSLLKFSDWDKNNLKLEFTRVQPEEDASSEDVPSVQDEDDDLL